MVLYTKQGRTLITRMFITQRQTKFPRMKLFQMQELAWVITKIYMFLVYASFYYLCNVSIANRLSRSRLCQWQRGEWGKPGQCRAPHHLTNGVSVQPSWIGIQKVLQKITAMPPGMVRVKMCGKSARSDRAICLVNKPCGLKCHVYLSSSE